MLAVNMIMSYELAEHSFPRFWGTDTYDEQERGQFVTIYGNPRMNEQRTIELREQTHFMEDTAQNTLPLVDNSGV